MIRGAIGRDVALATSVAVSDLHLLIVGPRHLNAVLREYLQHYGAYRPHRTLHQRPPIADTPPRSDAVIRPLRRDRLGGLIHEYVQVAWHNKVPGTHREQAGETVRTEVMMKHLVRHLRDLERSFPDSRLV